MLHDFINICFKIYIHHEIIFICRIRSCETLLIGFPKRSDNHNYSFGHFYHSPFADCCFIGVFSLYNLDA